jgi:hypothetical protein
VPSAASHSAGLRSSTTSAPNSRHASILPAEQVTAIRAPIALAIWIAAVPTPEAPACTSAQRPLVRPTLHDERVPRREEHLGHGCCVGRGDRCGNRERLTGVRDDLLGVAAAGFDPHRPIADRPAGHVVADRRDDTGELQPGDLDRTATRVGIQAPSAGGCPHGSRRCARRRRRFRCVPASGRRPPRWSTPRGHHGNEGPLRACAGTYRSAAATGGVPGLDQQLPQYPCGYQSAGADGPYSSSVATSGATSGSAARRGQAGTNTCSR